MFFFHAEYSFVVLCGLVKILDIDCDMPDSWFFHVLPPFRFLILAFTDFLSILHPLPSILSCKISSMVSSPSPAPRPRDRERKYPGILLRHPTPSALFLPSRILPKTVKTYRCVLRLPASA